MSNGHKPLKVARAALFGTTALVLSAAVITPATADEVDEIKVEMQRLLDRMEQLEQDQARTDAAVKQTNVAIEQAAGKSPWLSGGGVQRKRASVVNPATTQEDYFVQPQTAQDNAVSGGDFPGSFKLPGSDTSMAIYGFVHASYIWNFGARQPLGVFPNLIDGSFQTPDGTAGSGLDGNANFRANPTQINIETRTPSEYGEVKTHIQIDTFNGDVEGGGNNSTIGQLVVGTRLMQASIGPITVGQHWWAMTDFNQYAETVDYNNNTAAPLGRLVGITWAENVGNGFSYAVGMYDPVTQIVAPRGAVAAGGSVGANALAGVNAVATTTTPFTTNDTVSVPMFAGNVTYSQDWGSIFLGGQLRQMGYDIDSSGHNAGIATAANIDTTTDNWIAQGLPTDETEFGWGVTLSLAMFDPLGLGSRDKFFIGGAYGEGIRGIINQSLDNFMTNAPGGSPNEGVINPFTGEIETNVNWGWSAHYQHWWTETIRSTIMWSQTFNDSDNDFDPVGVQRAQRAMHLNLFWSPVPRVNLGVELNYEYGRFKAGDGIEILASTIPVGAEDADRWKLQFGALFLY